MKERTEEGRKSGSDRREFLKLAGLSAPAAVAAVATLGASEAAAKPVDPSSDRLQDTAHTRAYYASTKF